MTAENKDVQDLKNVEFTDDNAVEIGGNVDQENELSGQLPEGKVGGAISKAKTSKKKKKTNFPTPTNIENYESYGFGSFKNSGGMYIYVNGPYMTISLSQSKYLNSIVEIDNQSKSKKKSLLLAISSIRNNRTDTESTKYIKVAFEYHKKEGSLDIANSRVLLVQRFITTTEDTSQERSVGILILLKDFLSIKDFIYNPGVRSLAVEDDSEVDF